jgi:hypothetical protein
LFGKNKKRAKAPLCTRPFIHTCRDSTIITKKGNFNFKDYTAAMAGKDVFFSLVVPAYNEETRLPKMLKETIEVKVELKLQYF